MNKFGILTVFALLAIARCESEPESDRSVLNTDFEIISLNVISTVQARFATTLITSQVANRASSAKEITFRAQLPDAAFISNFSMRIDEQIIYGEVKEKEKAKAEFDAAKARGESTGLVAKTPRETNSFTISVNVAAHSRVRFNLTYQEVLRRVHGVYKHIINLQPDQPVSECKVDVYITERGEITSVKVPRFGEKIGEKTNKELRAAADEKTETNTILKENGTHSIHIHYQPEQKTKLDTYTGQLVVLYDVKRDKTAGDIEVVNGYFVHFFAPEGLGKRPKNIVFVLDKSGSMQGRKMSQLKDAMKVILNDLDSDDTFRIIVFSDATETWRREFSKATRDNVRAAITYVEDTLADGGTNIYDSLQEAIRTLKDSPSAKVPMILFLTDGQPTVGETNRDKIVRDATRSNDEERKIIIHSVAFGEDADYAILRKISSRNRGLARRVYEDSDSSIQLAGFYEEISSPVLTNLKIEYLDETVDTTSVVQDTGDNYYDGSEVVAVGKVRDDKWTSTATFNAKASGQGAAGRVDVYCRSYPPITCRDPWWPDTYYDDPVALPTSFYYRPSIWCCPPPRCCWWRRCLPPPPPPPPPTPKPRELLPASTVGGFVERMWAYQTIKKLLKSNDLSDDDVGTESAKKKALELSLKYHFVTDLTSMVVVKPNEPIRILEERRPCCSSAGAATGVNSASAGGGFRGSPSGQTAAKPSSTAGAGEDGGFAAAGGGSPNRGQQRPPPPAPAPSSGGKKEETETDDRDKAGRQKPGESSSGTETDEKDKAGRQKPGESSSACTSIEIVFIKDNATVTSAIDSRRGDYAAEALNQVKSSSNINAKAALVDAFTNGQASIVNGMDAIANVIDSFKRRVKSSTPNSYLVQTINAQFGQYSSSNVKRYAVFLITSKSVQYAVDTANQLRRHSVVVYVVSLVDDKSSSFSSTLSSISQELYFVPPSSGNELGQALSKC